MPDAPDADAATDAGPLVTGALPDATDGYGAVWNLTPADLSAPVTALDAATGETVLTYKGTEHTEEILAHDGVLYLVVGTSEGVRVGGGLHLRGEPEPTDFRYVDISP